jgi:hypothetical protein
MSATEISQGIGSVFAATVAGDPPPRFDTADEPAPPRSGAKAFYDGCRNRLAYSGWWHGLVGGFGAFLKQLGHRLEEVERRSRGKAGPG